MANWSKIARRIRVPLGFAFTTLYLFLAQPTPRFMLLGALLILPGLWLRGLASGYVQKNEVLSMEGPYAYTRNPLYLGSLLVGIGFGIAARSWWIALALVIMFVAIYLPVIRDEEKFLMQKFPAFDEYAKHVPRIVPRPNRLERAANQPGGRFSLALYLRHREYQALIGAVALMAALAIKLLLAGHK